MERKNVAVTPDEVTVVDGKVVISSEELAAAIQNYDFDAVAEEEACSFNLFCTNIGGTNS